MAADHEHQSLPPQPPQIGPLQDRSLRRARFARDELAIVLSRYDLGVIEKVWNCPRGSRRAPKLRILSSLGDFLLKRRAPGHDDPQRVAVSHAILLHLHARGYPVPRLIAAGGDGSSMLQHGAHIYELFDYIEGRRTDHSPAATVRSGAALGHLHRLLEGFQPQGRPAVGSFHAAAEVGATFRAARSALVKAEPELESAVLDRLIADLQQAYDDAAQRVDAAGFPGWPPVLLHGDWHPGNLLYRDGEVVAVLDFDSARLEPRLADIANGALQFSINMGQPDDPLGWPDGVDARQIKAFVRGYDAARRPVGADERSALPWMMIEALIVESIIPIAATGTFAGIRGSEFLRMVRRKVGWLRPRAAKLTEYLGRAEP